MKNAGIFEGTRLYDRFTLQTLLAHANETIDELTRQSKSFYCALLSG